VGQIAHQGFHFIAVDGEGRCTDADIAVSDATLEASDGLPLETIEGVSGGVCLRNHCASKPPTRKGVVTLPAGEV
jgi:hypothetical protein